MRAYYFDNLPGDQRLPHDSKQPVPTSTLSALGLIYMHIPISSSPPAYDQINFGGEPIDQIARERGYRNRDTISVTKEGLGDAYEAKIRGFYEEHMHEDEEIRYILDGSGFFDVREHPTDAWIRIHLATGDLLVLPSGIYHRFTLDERNSIKAMRLFKDEPKWTPYNRGAETDANPYRQEYLQAISAAA